MSELSEQWPAGAIVLSEADIEALDARWRTAWAPSEVARRLAGVSTPWYVAAGWALDLFRGGQREDQADFDATVPRMRLHQREMLAELLEHVHPGHAWLEDL